MMVFCTLFDSNYLDKGLVLYDSIKQQTDDFKLYIFAMDDITYEILKELNLSGVIMVPLSSFLDDELRIAKGNRTRGEFCWTCSAYSISYVLNHYKEDMCTYIDADLYFYKNPVCLFEELGDSSIGIIEHRNNRNYEGRFYDRLAGPYCVEFNTFRNDVLGQNALKWWKEKVFECCSAERNGKTFGDQKYLEDWPRRFDGVHIYADLGAGMAPWNIAQYHKTEGGLFFCGTAKVDPVFYHFHAIDYLNGNTANIHVFYRSFKTDKRMVFELYKSYFAKIEEKRDFLAVNYNIDLRKNVQKNTNNGSLFSKIKGKKVSEILLAVDVIIRSKLTEKLDRICF